MTVEANSTEERLRARALDTLKTHTLETILASPEPLRTGDVGRMVNDRLGLDLTEEEGGGLASLVRMVMDSDPMFSQANRQWGLAMRMDRAEGDRRKPVERAIEDFVDLLGHPADIALLAELLSAVYKRDAEFYVDTVQRLVDSRPQFFRVGSRVAIDRWVIEVSSDDAADVEFDNFDDEETVAAVRAYAAGVDGGDPLSYARGVVAAAGGEPVDGRALLFLTWEKFRDANPRAIFQALCTDSAVVLERGPKWVTRDSAEEVLTAIRDLARDVEGAADLLASALPEGQPEGPLAAATVRVSDDDLAQVASYMESALRTYRVPELCQQALEAFPGSRTYQAVHDSLLGRMKEDSRFVWLGWDRFRVRGGVPDEVEVLPEGLAFPPDQEYLGEDGQEVDRVVDPKDWKFQLAEQITHYQVQDLTDDATAPGKPPKELVSSVPLHHYVAGTRYLRHSDAGFFPAEPEVFQVTIVPPDGQKFDVWVNHRLRLIMGLKEWYDANLPWVGGQYTLKPGDTPDEFRLAYTAGDVDPLMDIPLDRLQALLQLRAEAVSAGMPLTNIVTQILREAGDGIHFVNLFTQVNVVRRTRRAALANILSGQRYFQQSPQQPGIWSYDEKRAAKPKKKGAPKRVREYDEDDDLGELE
jgi:hypothetical protein